MKCRCGSDEERYPVHDAQGIFLAYVCEKFEKEVLSQFRPEILSGYTQEDVDEPIEPEE